MRIFSLFFIILGSFWLIRTIKEILFYLYLWQLKEYHLGRFIDHFRTKKGKSLIWNWKYLVKVILLGIILISPLFGIGILSSFYILESFLFLYKVYGKKIKLPVFTKKTIPLMLISLSFPLLFLYLIVYELNSPFTVFTLSLLIFDILIPLIISLLVFLIELLVYIKKKQIMEKAKRKRKKFNSLKVIGITGSYGKTSTKEILAAILEDRFNILKTTEHINSEMGISQLILDKLNSNHEIFVCEIGAYNKGGIKLVTDIINPEVGIITGINQQHMATFGSQEKIIDTKLELVEELPPNGTAILNLDSKIIQERKEKVKNYNPNLKNIFFTSTKEKVCLWAEDIKVSKKELSFKIVTEKGESEQFHLKIAGRQNIENILTAVCCAMELGMNLKEIKKVIFKVEKALVGLKVIEKEGMDIIDSSYSSNPTGVIADLEHLKYWEGKKVIILRPLIELGSSSQKVHEKIGEKIGEVCDLAVLVTKDHIKEIKKGAIRKGLDSEKIIFINDLKGINFKEGVILLEGRISDETKRDLNLL